MSARLADAPNLCLLAALLACGAQEEIHEAPGSEIVRTAEIDWSFAEDLSMAFLQTTNPPRSRAVWVLVHEGDLYIPSGIARRTPWPRAVEDDPIVLLRVMDRLYLRLATRISDPAELSTLREAVRDKYGTAPRANDESSGFFRMDPAPDRG